MTIFSNRIMIPRAVRCIYSWCSNMNSVTAGRPPSLSNAAVVKLVKDYFPFKAVDELSVKQFPPMMTETSTFVALWKKGPDPLPHPPLEQIQRQGISKGSTFSSWEIHCLHLMKF